MKRAKVFVLVALLVATVPWVSMAQPTLQGSLTGTLGPGTYTVVGNCTVDAGNSLTIAAGTTIQFSGHFSIKVYGTLQAVGTQTNMIHFVRQSQTTTCDWGGIRFMTGSSANSTLSYCDIQGARYQTWPDVNGGGVYIESVPLTISHCKFNNNYSTTGAGIYATNAAVTITDCIFMNGTAGNGGGIMLYSASGSSVRNCIIARNSATST
ncbi:MAG: right-handed parallel beta-helix repeat-containing protein [bacterium]|nr:right-handed parallel beta-helix repeat-containing protein [bacterium]